MVAETLAAGRLGGSGDPPSGCPSSELAALIAGWPGPRPGAERPQRVRCLQPCRSGLLPVLVRNTSRSTDFPRSSFTRLLLLPLLPDLRRLPLPPVPRRPAAGSRPA